MKLPMGPVKAGKAIRKLVTAIHGVDPEAEDTGTNPQAPPGVMYHLHDYLERTKKKNLKQGTGVPTCHHFLFCK